MLTCVNSENYKTSSKPSSVTTGDVCITHKWMWMIFG